MSCRHLPRTSRVYSEGGYTCHRPGCGKFVSQDKIRKGKNLREYAIRAELDAARRYGGRKTNDGGPVDFTGTDFDNQMKTHRRQPPKEWTEAFAKMPGKKLRRLLVRYVQGPGRAPVDFWVVPGPDWLQWYGKDGDQP